MEIHCSFYGLVIRNETSFKGNMQACAISNLALTIPTFLVNMTLIVAILTSNERKKPCQKMLLNLAFADSLTGLTSMPFHFVEFRLIAALKDPCNFSIFAIPLGYAVGIASFLTITIIAMERYMKIFYPYFYYARFNSSAIAIYLSLIWVISSVCVIPTAVTRNARHLNVIVLFIAAFGTSINIFCYMRILFLARRTRRQIHAEEARFGVSAALKKDRDLIFIGGLIIASLSVCYAPIIVSNLMRLLDVRCKAWDYALCWEWTFAMGNSLINPLISCVFNPVIRTKAKAMWSRRTNRNPSHFDRSVNTLHVVSFRK